MVRSRLKTDYVLLAGVVFLLLFNVVIHWLPRIEASSFFGAMISFLLRNSPTLLWIGLSVFWMFSLKDEILDDRLRHVLYGGASLLILLFVLRVCRYNLVTEPSVFNRLLWYAYYIPICVIPLLSMDLSLSISRRGRNPRLMYRETIVLGILCAGMVLLMLTNDIHRWAFQISYREGREYVKSGILYYIVVIWSFGMMFFSFVRLFLTSRLTESRTHFWISVLVCSFGIWMLAVYYINGGNSPTLGGVRLYNLQEALWLSFVGFWESCILIGLIPSASMVREKDWIREVIEETVHEQEQEIRNIFDQMWSREARDFQKKLIQMACLGVYIKRRANLEIISDEQEKLSTTELALSIRESFEYYTLAGISVGIEETGKGEVPSLLLVVAYEIFEDIMERACTACYVKLQTGISDDEERISFRMLLETDAMIGMDDFEAKGTVPDSVKKPVWKGAFHDSKNESAGKENLLVKRREFLQILGAGLSVRKEDDTCYLELRAEYPLTWNGFSSWRLLRNKEHRISYGLLGLTANFSLEREALAAKIHFHDSMGRSLLMTRYYLSNPEGAGRDALMTEWSRSLLFIEKNGSWQQGEEHSAEEIVRFCTDQARQLGIDVKLTGTFPENAHIRFIIDTAVTVQITNVLKHTTGHTVFVEVKEGEDVFFLTLTNDGTSKKAEFLETGGLKNLRGQIEEAGGSMEVQGGDRFFIYLVLPKQSGAVYGAYDREH